MVESLDGWLEGVQHPADFTSFSIQRFNHPTIQHNFGWRVTATGASAIRESAFQPSAIGFGSSAADSRADFPAANRFHLPSPFIRTVAVQFPFRRARGRLQQVLLQVHDQPPVVRRRIIIIAERHPPEAAPDRSLDLGVVG